jgi:hypothetical protein
VQRVAIIARTCYSLQRSGCLDCSPDMQGSPPSKTVVVADDTAFVRDRFKAAIETAGHRALTVKSAAELLARVRADL